MEHFNAHREIDKYSLDLSTFDLIDVKRFHNLKCSTVFDYLFTWFLMILGVVLLGVDIYTCLNILVFHRWSSDDYKPYAYSVAKWIFTGCIIFQFVLLFYHWIWAIHTYRTRNIALAYVNNIARHLYTIKSYDYHCLFNSVEHDNFFDWACFLAYFEMDGALQILVADTPRQVINVLTLRYYATDEDSSNDIIQNIKNIASTNVRLSVILSFMLLSVAIWSIFFFRFVFGMVCYIPCLVKIRKRGHSGLKKYCCSVVNLHVRRFVFKHHKPRSRLLEEGILDLKEINENPLLNSSSTATFDSAFQYKPELPKAFQPGDWSLESLPRQTTQTGLGQSRQNTYELLRYQPEDTQPQANQARRLQHPAYPRRQPPDYQALGAQGIPLQAIHRKPPNPFADEYEASSENLIPDPFADKEQEDIYELYRHVDSAASLPRSGSASSLTEGHFAPGQRDPFEPYSAAGGQKLSQKTGALAVGNTPNAFSPDRRTTDGVAPQPGPLSRSGTAPYPLGTDPFDTSGDTPLEEPSEEESGQDAPYPIREPYMLRRTYE